MQSTDLQFVPLHVHSHYSLLEGADSVKAIVERAAACGVAAMAMADTNAMHGAVEFYQAARAAGVRPILGVMVDEPGAELLGTENRPGGAADPPYDRRQAYVVALASSRAGYASVCHLVTARRLDDRFDLAAAVAKYQKDVIFLTPEPQWLARLAGVVEKGNLYAELINYEDRRLRPRLRATYAKARELGLPMAATNPAWFATADRWNLHRVLRAIGTLQLAEQVPAEQLAHREAYIKSPAQMQRLFAAAPEALANTLAIADRCRCEIELGKPIFPSYPIPENETADGLLRTMAFDGLTRRYRKIAEPVRQRLEYELDVIRKLGFSQYFLIVRGIVEFAEREGIAHVGRGSAGNSLVAYCLGITQVDPIAYDLYFERFLNLARTDVPDIDLDFDWRRRDEVLKYIYNTYGASHVAMIATLNTFSARSAFRDAAKTFGLPPNEINRLAGKLPYFSAEGIRRAIQSFPECRDFPIDQPLIGRIVDYTEQIDGYPRHLSIHVGGVVVADKPLPHYVPLQRSAKGLVITQMDMGPIERMGLVKIDILAHRSLGIVTDAVEMVRKDRGVEIELDAIPPDDPQTARTLRAGRTIGCFQIESPAMRNLLQMMGGCTRMDVIHGLSLIRPGPSSSGMKEHYIRRRLGREEPAYLHPAMRRILADTYGVMLYQEDIMKVAAAVADFSMATGDELRKHLTKRHSIGHIEKLRKQFLAGARKNGADLQAAKMIWELISNFAAYAYNKAHACTYGHISYQATYLKTHWPVEFFCAVLNNIGGFYPQREYVEDARRFGVTLLGPHVNASGVWYACERRADLDADAQRRGGRGEEDSSISETANLKNFSAPSSAPLRLCVHPSEAHAAFAVRVGLMQVRNLKHRTMRRIVELREAGGHYKSLEDFCARVEPSIDEARNLVLCGAMDGLGRSRPELLWQIDATFGLLSRRRLEGEEGSLFDPAAAAPAEEAPPLAEYPTPQRMALEQYVLGLTPTDHPLAAFERSLAGRRLTTAAELGRHVGRRVTVAGLLIATRRARTKGGEFMKFLSLEDASGVVEVVLFPKVYQAFGAELVGYGPFVVRGKVEDNHGAVTLAAEHVQRVGRQEEAAPKRETVLSS